MENISNEGTIPIRDIHYYRRRYKNRVFGQLAAFFASEAKRRGVKQRDLATKLHTDPALISRWLRGPSNLTLDTISDLLLGLGAEMDSQIVRFEERAKPNYSHPYIEKTTGVTAGTATPIKSARGIGKTTFGLTTVGLVPQATETANTAKPMVAAHVLEDIDA